MKISVAAVVRTVDVAHVLDYVPSHVEMNVKQMLLGHPLHVEVIARMLAMTNVIHHVMEQTSPLVVVAQVVAVLVAALVQAVVNQLVRVVVTLDVTDFAQHLVA